MARRQATAPEPAGHRLVEQRLLVGMGGEVVSLLLPVVSGDVVPAVYVQPSLLTPMIRSRQQGNRLRGMEVRDAAIGSSDPCGKSN